MPLFSLQTKTPNKPSERRLVNNRGLEIRRIAGPLARFLGAEKRPERLAP